MVILGWQHFSIYNDKVIREDNIIYLWYHFKYYLCKWLKYNLRRHMTMFRHPRYFSKQFRILILLVMYRNSNLESRRIKAVHRKSGYVNFRPSSSINKLTRPSAHHLSFFLLSYYNFLRGDYEKQYEAWKNHFFQGHFIVTVLLSQLYLLKKTNYVEKH